MTRAADNQQPVFSHMKHVAHIIRYKHILVGHNAFNRRNHEFLAYVYRQFGKMALEIWRWHNHQQRVGLGCHIVYIRRKHNALHIKLHIGQISRVMPQTHELLYAVIAAHIP